MKILMPLLLLVLLAIVGRGQDSWYPLFENSTTDIVVPAGRSSISLEEVFSVEPFYGPDYTQFRVSISLHLNGGGGYFLKGTSTKVALAPGQEVGSQSIRYLDFPDFPEWMLMHVYTWKMRFPGSRLSGRAVRDSFTNQLSVLIGFARPYMGGTQYGWVRMEREPTKPSELIGPNGEVRQVQFLPTAYAVNPFPDRPIRAGESPDLPALSTEVLADPSGPTRVRVRWPAGYPGIRLEWAAALKSSMEWLPVDGVVGEEASFEVSDDGQLYLRLGLAP